MASQLTQHTIKVLLIDDQPIIGKTVEQMLQQELDIEFFYCENPTQALESAKKIQPTVILQDLVMPQLDGLVLLRYFRAFEQTKEIPMIVLSSKEEPIVKAKAFELGANDYLVKLPDKIELIARIRYHSQAYIHLLEKKEAYQKLIESQALLQKELDEAADYVLSILPPFLNEEITTQWKFISSTSLGGDAFGYHKLDETKMAFYLLDVCGHGVGAALLSISVLNVVRSGSLAKAQFDSPKSVLENLNNAFQMENQNNMFFTMWYGVYDSVQEELVYATAGHPPALLFSFQEKDPRCLQLKTPGMIVGGMLDQEYHEQRVRVKKGDRLYLYSDGAFELTRPDGSMITFEEFLDFFHDHLCDDKFGVDTIYEYAQNVQSRKSFDDDFSILQVIF